MRSVKIIPWGQFINNVISNHVMVFYVVSNLFINILVVNTAYLISNNNNVGFEMFS